MDEFIRAPIPHGCNGKGIVTTTIIEQDLYGMFRKRTFLQMDDIYDGEYFIQKGFDIEENPNQ